MKDRSLSIALVVPSYNQGQFVTEALGSIFSQGGVSIDVALCDAGSTDDTLALVERYRNRFAFFRSRPDKGQAAAINEGIAQLPETPYVGWLNADDVLLPNALIRMAQFLDQNPRYVAVFGKAYLIDKGGSILAHYPTRPFHQRHFAIECTICQPASLIRRSAWEASGGLDESIQTCLDYDLWWRLSKVGPIGYLDHFLACTRDHARSKTRTQRKVVHEEAVSILLRHRGMVPRNWCMANLLEGLVDSRRSTYLGRRWEALLQYVRINGWKALLPQNWFF